MSGLVITLKLCEQDIIILKPNVYYIFEVDEACDKCIELRDAGEVT